MQEPKHRSKLSRRKFLRLVGLGAGALALGGYGVIFTRDKEPLPGINADMDSDSSAREYSFEASPLHLEVGGHEVPTWGYDGIVPGPEIRVTEGDTLRVIVQNHLPADTTVHWHGLPVPNAMDGVPGITQPPIRGGEDFVYEFVVSTAGTYIYHTHLGLQQDREVKQDKTAREDLKPSVLDQSHHSSFSQC